MASPVTSKLGNFHSHLSNSSWFSAPIHSYDMLPLKRHRRGRLARKPFDRCVMTFGGLAPTHTLLASREPRFLSARISHSWLLLSPLAQRTCGWKRRKAAAAVAAAAAALRRTLKSTTRHVYYTTSPRHELPRGKR